MRVPSRRPTSWRACARRAGSGPAAPAAEQAFTAGCLGVRHRAGVPRGLRAARAGAALQPHHRAERGRRGAALPGTGEYPPRERHSLLIDAGAEFAGYASDTPALTVPGCGFRGAHRPHGSDAAGAVRRCRAGVDWREVHLNATGSPGNCCVRQTSFAAAPTRQLPPRSRACCSADVSGTCSARGA